MGDGLASLLNVGLHFRDNTSLYMKGMYIALLHARLTELDMPIHYPDLANAPVRYMMIDDSQQYQPQLEVIRSAVQEGVFILLEGLEWSFMLQQYYHYLAVGGPIFAIGAQDEAIAAQAFRWPRIRMLILTRTPPPAFGPAPQFLGTSMISALSQLAVARGEEDMFDRGWYHASYLLASEWVTRFSLIDGANAVPMGDAANPAQLPVALEIQDPFQVNAAGDPTGHHHRLDLPDGRRGFGDPYDPQSLHIPDPAIQLARANQAAQAAYEQRLAQHNAAQDRQQNAAPVAFAEQPPVAAVPVANTVRPAHVNYVIPQPFYTFYSWSAVNQVK